MSNKLSDNGTKRTRPKSYSQKYIIECLLKLRENNYNISQTANQMNVSPLSIKKWRELYPEVITNKFNTTTIAKIEETSKNKAVQIIDSAGNVVLKALSKGLQLLDSEDDLNKVSNFIRAVTPIASIMSEADKENGNKTMSDLKTKLGEMQRVMNNNLEIEDAEIVK